MMKGCNTCKYGTKLGADDACDYLGMTGQRRPSEGPKYSKDGKCDSYEPRPENRKKWVEPKNGF